VQTLALGDKAQAAVIGDLTARGLKQVAAAGPGNTIFVRGTAEQIRLAESIVANPNQPASVLDVNGVYLAENGTQTRTPESARSQLKIKTAGSISLDVNESAQTTYETLARNAGINVLFGRGYRPTPIRLALKDVAFSDALDLLALASGSFWQPLNDNTFLVAEDNQQNRRDYAARSVETIYLPGGIPNTRLNEIMRNLRGTLGLTASMPVESASAIVIHDTPARLILAETMIAEMTGSPIIKKVATDPRTVFGENGTYFHTAASDRARLQIRPSGPISFSSNTNTKDAYEKLAALGGLNVVFGRGFQPGNTTFSIQNVDVIEALDFLTLQSGTFWQPLDSRTILVQTDNQQNRRDFQVRLVKTIYLPREIPIQAMNGILNMLRTSLTIRAVMQHEDARAIVIHDTPQRMALVETVIEHVNAFSTPSKSVDILAPRFAENGSFGIAAAMRPELALKTTGPISINVNQDTRNTYEALGDIAGLNVTFSPDFPAGTVAPFRMAGVDILDAFDYLSLTTGNSWRAVDKQTILVRPGSTPDPQAPVTKIFHIVNKTGQGTVNNVGNVLRTVMLMRGVQIADGTITVVDTPQRLAIAENIIASLDRAP
jgi:hypothetical protein